MRKRLIQVPTFDTARRFPAARAAALRLPLLAALLAAGACGQNYAPLRAPWEGPATPQTQAMEKAVDKACRRNRTADVAVAYLDIATGARVLRQETQQFHAASTMKLPVMIAAWEAIDAGQLSLERQIPIGNDFRSIVDGTRYHLAPADDADPDLYAAVGGTRPLSELIRRMIVRSSNLATNVLVDLLTASRITEDMRQMGAYDIHVLRGVEDEKAFQAGFVNEVTAADLMLVLSAVARAATAPDSAPAAFDAASSSEPVASPAISQRAAAAMIEVLKAQEFNDKIPAGLPPGTPVAHKTGDITLVHHDAAIVYPPGESPYVLVVLTQGFGKEEDANRFIAELSRIVWQTRHQQFPPPSGRHHA
jgi:beta-lactamase class A